MKFLLRRKCRLDCLIFLATASLDYLEQIVGVAMWPGSLQTAGELDVSDRRSRLVNVPVVNKAVNRGLVNVSIERVDEVLSVRVVLLVRGLVS